MVAINVSLQNNSDKPSVIHTIQASIDTGSSTLTDDAAPDVDAQRYFEAFPGLRAHALDILKVETRMNPGRQTVGNGGRELSGKGGRVCSAEIANGDGDALL